MDLASYSDDAEMAKLTEIAESLGIEFDEITQRGSQRNLVGIRSKRTLFSHRLDSRTYFIHDAEYGWTRKAGVFDGPDTEQLDFCRGVMSRLGLPNSEIAEAHVIREKTREAHLDAASGNVSLTDVRDGNSFSRVTRRVEGLPVWSSTLVLGLTRGKRIGFMVLHWPEIPGRVLTEAHRLAYEVEHGWRAPEQKGGVVESVEAGIVHSPATSFVMDIYPAVRVVHTSLDKRIGLKSVMYLDRDGKFVPFPRVHETTERGLVHTEKRPRGAR
jgi:hypothetical protein